MITGDNTILHLLQLTDSALPIGGFSYSQGMESALKHGLITTYEDVKRYLITYIHQIMSFDFPFIKAAYEHHPLDASWEDITHTFEAMLMNPVVRKSSAVMGKNIMNLINDIHPSAALQKTITHFASKLLSFHFPIAFGIVSSELKIPTSSWMQAYLYTCLRDQVSAMTRLGFIGSQGGQELLSMLVMHSYKLLQQQHEIVAYTQASKSAYMLDLAQLNHPHVYSKLFQN